MYLHNITPHYTAPLYYSSPSRTKSHSRPHNSYLFASQSQILEDVSVAVASTASFANAVKSTVHDVVGQNVSTVSSVVVTAVAGSRKMLSSTTLSYTVSLASALTTDQVVRKLQVSMDNGRFLKLLRSYSGIMGQKSSNPATVVDANAKTAPTDESSTVSIGNFNTSILQYFMLFYEMWECTLLTCNLRLAYSPSLLSPPILNSIMPFLPSPLPSYPLLSSPLLSSTMPYLPSPNTTSSLPSFNPMNSHTNTSYFSHN